MESCQPKQRFPHRFAQESPSLQKEPAATLGGAKTEAKSAIYQWHQKRTNCCQLLYIGGQSKKHPPDDTSNHSPNEPSGKRKTLAVKESSLKHCEECPAEGPEVLVDFMAALHLRSVELCRPCHAQRLDSSMLPCSGSQRGHIEIYMYLIIM